MIINILFLSYFVFLYFVKKIQGFDNYSIVQIQNLFWIIGFFIYSINLLDFYVDFHPNVYICSFLYLTAFNVFYYKKSPSVYKILNSRDNDVLSNLAKGKRENRCIILSLAAYFLSIPILYKSVPVLLTSDSISDGMNYLRWQTYGDNSIFTTLDHMTRDYIIRPIFFVTILYTSVRIALRKISFKMFFIAFLDALMLVVLSAARALIVSFVLYVIVSVLTFNRMNIRKIWEYYKSYLIPAICFVAFSVTLMLFRVSRDNNAFVEFLHYIYGGIPYFSEMMYKDSVNEFQFYGQATLSAIIDNIGLILRFLGERIELASNYISHLSNENLQIGKDSYTNATASTLLPFYLDFGFFGEVLAGSLWGYICCSFENLTAKKMNILNLCRYLFLLLGFAFSIQNYSMGGPTVLVTWIMMWLLLK